MDAGTESGANTEAAEVAGDPDPSPSEVPDDESGGGATDSREERATRYLLWVAVAVLGVTAVVALVGFYGGVSAAIREWVTPAYRPLVNAAFNLALLLAALAGIGLLLRRRD